MNKEQQIINIMKAADCSYTTAERLYEAGYRKQSDTVKELADKLNEHLYKKIALDNRVAEKASMVCVSKHHSTISCQSVLDFTNKLAAEYGVEVE